MAGIIKANTLQLGDSGIADNNFHLKTNVDGSLSLNRGNDGAPSQEVLAIAGTETVQRIMTFDALPATGTSVDFTGIPSWAKEITVMFDGVSTNGSSLVQVQLGAGSIQTTGYLGSSDNQALNGGTATTFTSGLVLERTSGESYFRHGLATFCLASANTFVGTYLGSTTTIATVAFGSTKVTLAGILDRIRITTVNGTDLFDAGSINILVKG